MINYKVESKLNKKDKQHEKGVEKMKFIKDFIYDKNDIVIAFLILVLAAGLIAWRMDVIMSYPQTLADKTGPTKTAVEDMDDNDASNSTDTETSSDGIWSGDVLASDVTVTVQAGAAMTAVQSLVDAGLFSSYEDFEKVCKSAGCAPLNIKATTFTFGAGATKADIAKTVTN